MRNVEVLNRMDELRTRTSEIASDIQALSHQLHSPRLEYLGLVAAMKGFCQEFGEKQKLEIDFKNHDLPRPVPPDISLSLFRVLQEALHNAAKHSGASRFAVHLWGTPGEIHLMVSDAGARLRRRSGDEGPRAWAGQHAGANQAGERRDLDHVKIDARHRDTGSRSSPCGKHNQSNRFVGVSLMFRDKPQTL